MKKPIAPPDVASLPAKVGMEKMVELLSTLGDLPARPDYLHWDKLVHLSPPAGVSHEQWWWLLKWQRRPLYKNISLKDTKGQPFRFLTIDPIPEELHKIDQSAGGRIGISAPVINSDTKDQYYVSSLIEEAITSSQLEGAVTTRKVAKEMLLTQRPPNDRSERMVLNNFVTMQRVGELKNQPLTKELVFDLHYLVTQETLEDASAAGRFRRADDEDEDIVVKDNEGVIYHVPPCATELEERMAAMCAFANGETPSFFVHPVLRAIILHFWLAYDHPFVDGNGRTARALFYWAMLRYGYWLCEFISISRILKKAHLQYGRSFLYTESDDNDLTYFILYQLDVLRRAIRDLNVYIEEVEEQRAAEQRLQGMLLFNHRQRSLISHALRHPKLSIHKIEGHRTSHNIVYQTARTDLQQLAIRTLTAYKIGKTWYITPSPTIEKQLKKIN